jgi:4-hydroxy-tetrahydrodipicolinate synthase
MVAPARLTGVLSPVVTPFAADLAPDADRLAAHCRWLVANGVGLAVFGTNSEANSLSTGEKLELLERLAEAGIPAGRMLPGTGCCALPDTVALTRRAVELGCAGVLMLPPFYYKEVDDEGLFRSYAEVIERVGDARLRIYLYHIPQVSGVPIRYALIERLLAAYPDAVAGIKDSSGNWENTAGMLERFQPRGFDVFAGSENFLLATLRGGGAGCITATANVNPAPIARLAASWRQADADAQQAALDAVRAAFAKSNLIGAMKAVLAHVAGDPEWARLRPPLIELDADARSELLAALDALGFAMPGLEARRG